MIRTVVNSLLPVGSKRRQHLRHMIKKFRAARTGELTYEQWVKEIEPKTITSSVKLNYRPLISIIVPAYNTPDKYLNPLIDSIIAQTYPNWELVLVEGSPDPRRAAAIANAAQKDKRIQLIKLGRNEGISGNTNIGMKQAKGEFIAFCDHDDTLAPFALMKVAEVLQQDPAVELFYSDEDKLSDDGKTRLDPFFKPDWSPDLFFAVNYLAHFVVIKKTLVDKVGGLRTGYDGAQDFDFLLRALDFSPKIYHVPHLSYHWRLAEGSTAKAVDQKNYADSAGKRALGEYVQRNQIKAAVTNVPDQPTNYRLRYDFKSGIKLRMIAPATAVAAIDHRDFTLSETQSELTLFVSGNPNSVTAECLQELAGVALQPGKGLVGAILLDNASRILEAGYCIQNSRLEPIFRTLQPVSWTHLGMPSWPRDLTVPPLSCCLVRTQLIDDMDIDNLPGLAVTLAERGLTNVCWSYATVQANKTTYPSIKTVGTDHFSNLNLKFVNGQPQLRQ